MAYKKQEKNEEQEVQNSLPLKFGGKVAPEKVCFRKTIPFQEYE